MDTGRSPSRSHAPAMPATIAQAPAIGEPVAVVMAGKVMTASVT